MVCVEVKNGGIFIRKLCKWWTHEFFFLNYLNLYGCQDRCQPLRARYPIIIIIIILYIIFCFNVKSASCWFIGMGTFIYKKGRGGGGGWDGNRVGPNHVCSVFTPIFFSFSFFFFLFSLKKKFKGRQISCR